MRSRPALVATMASAALGVIKFAAWSMTGSSALLASAIDSGADALVSGGNLLVVRAAARPPDAGHPFGHGKLEHLAALFQALLIGGSVVFVTIEGIGALHDPSPIRVPGVGIGISLVSLVVALALATHLERAGEQLRSPALVADSKHYATDYLRDGAVVIAIGADAIFATRLIDVLASLLIAALILKIAVTLLLEAGHALIDHGLPDSEIAVIRQTLAQFSGKIRGYHDLLTRRSGPDRFVQLHVEIDDQISFRDAHEIVERIRGAIEDRLPGAQVTIHADPWPEGPDERPARL